MSWIPVSDKKKPELAEDETSLSVEVLVYTKRLGIRMGNYLHSSKVFRPSGSIGFEKDVTHWMPLPDAPPEAQP